jgi:DNA polymerase-1
MNIIHRQVLDVINSTMLDLGLPALKQKSTSTNGGEWYGKCPLCFQETGDGGTDRFIVWPNSKDRPVESYPGSKPVFMCRVCKRLDGRDRSGDLIQFCQDALQLDYAIARKFLGLPPKKEGPLIVRLAPTMAGFLTAPSPTWREAGRKLLDRSVETLWSENGIGAIEYLDSRHLIDVTIFDRKFGYIEEEMHQPASLWGLEGGNILIVPGILIPEFHINPLTGEEELTSLLIRKSDDDIALERALSGRSSKYHIIRGSQQGLFFDFTLDGKKPCFLVESAMDAITLFQEAGDLISPVATNGKNNARTLFNVSKLNALAPYTVIVKDLDGVNDTDLAAYWIEKLDKVVLELPLAHDVNDMMVVPGSVRKWVEKILLKYKILAFSSKNSDTHIDTHFSQKLPQIVTRNPVTSIIEQHPEVVPVISSSVEKGKEQMFLSNWYTCDNCEEEGTHIDMWGKRWCERHYPGNAGTIVDTLEGLEALVMRAGELPSRVVDIESTGLDPLIDKCVSITLAMPDDEVVIIDMRRFYDKTEQEKQQWRELLQELFSSEQTIWIGQNIKFDAGFMKIQFGVILHHMYDTMIADELIHAGETGLEMNLKYIAARYGLHVSKEERNWFIDLDKKKDVWKAAFPIEQRWYMVQDIEVPAIVAEKQQERIHALHLHTVVDIEMDLLPALVSMEVAGIRIDKDLWREVINKARKEHADLEQEIQKVLGEAIDVAQGHKQMGLFGEVTTTINLASHVQVKQALAHLGIELSSTSAKELEKQGARHEIIAKMIKWKKLEKFATSFGDAVLKYVSSDGRIHANFNQLVSTGRMSCKSPNLQQIPKAGEDDSYDVRRCFIAAPDHTLLIADLSNIELRILADLSGDRIMLRFFAEKKDLHSETARIMFGLTEQDDPENLYKNGVMLRQIAKNINFGIAYGMGPGRLSDQIGSTLEVAKELLTAYKNTYPELIRYLNRSGAQGVGQKYAVTFSGRRRNFAHMDLSDPAIRSGVERASKNHPIQGGSADILKVALTLLHNALPKEAHTVLTVHDEIVVESPITIQEEVKDILASCMEQACARFLKKVYFPPQKVVVSPFWKK